ncbi:uncharacterized protein [Rutidosis leptorrhynchoides]|uniref:uncharacterized protein n=1 Tax=Rutidosis leptorrhynchoides TaxID=125765 RepID=UPI003A9A52E5
MDSVTDVVKNMQDFRDRCLELEEKNKTYELRCLMLEDEVENLKKKNEELEAKIKTIQNIVHNEDEEDKLIELMIENKVLECEKTKAETEVCCLKDKVRELTSRMCELETKSKCTNEKVHEGISDVLKGTKEECCSQVRKRLLFEKMSPSTPGVGGQPFYGVIDVSDEDFSDENVRKANKCSDAKSQVSASAKRKRAVNIIASDDENSSPDDEKMDSSKVHSLKTRSAKRKRAVKIISSDDDASCDDSSPICTLVKTRRSSRYMKDSDDEVKKNGSTRYLTRLRKLESENIQDKSFIDMNKTVCLDGNSSSEDMEDNDVGSQSDSPSLGGYMKDSDDEVKRNGSTRYLTRLRKLESKNIQDKSVNDMNKTVCLYGNNSSSEDMEDNDEGSQSESSHLGGFITDDCESVSDGASKSDGSCDESESEDDYKGTLDKIGRKKVSNMKWDLEGDMLSDFGKDDELCMRAVCALYRQQTEDEKESKATIHNNNRGFSQPDAYRGTKLAEFLTEGHPGDDLNKTVKELKQFDSKGIELCRKLAITYSKQLFEIYQNKEDEYFMPPC